MLTINRPGKVSTLKPVSIVETRPPFIKIAPVSRVLAVVKPCIPIAYILQEQQL